MPRYYLHLTDLDHVMEDRDGFVAADSLEARDEAVRVIRELLRDGAWQPNSSDYRFISIADDEARLVEIVWLWQVLELDGIFSSTKT